MERALTGTVVPAGGAQPTAGRKALVMLSGGLDSSLAVKMMQQQGLEVEAITFSTPFCRGDCGKGCASDPREVGERLGVRVKLAHLGREYLEMVKKPKHGYGSQMNPCVDCRIMMFNRAREYMDACKASFIVTGEVVGQRPSSQTMKALRIIEEETGLKGLILRPLSAKALPFTIPEHEGWVDRRMLKGLRGRSRKSQMELAKKYGLTGYPNPSGGCRLTDYFFARRLRDLLQHEPNATLDDADLLMVGRHFRLSPEAKLVVGRNKGENERLQALAKLSDIFIQVRGHLGPLGLLRGRAGEELVTLSARIVARYSDAPKEGAIEVEVRDVKGAANRTVAVKSAEESLVMRRRV